MPRPSAEEIKAYLGPVTVGVAQIAEQIAERGEPEFVALVAKWPGDRPRATAVGRASEAISDLLALWAHVRRRGDPSNGPPLTGVLRLLGLYAARGPGGAPGGSGGPGGSENRGG